MKKYFGLLAAFALSSATFSCSSEFYLECFERQVKCENGRIYVCTGKELWSTKSEACESGICENVVKCQDPIISCTPNEQLCKGSVHYECNETGDAWATLDCAKLSTFCLAEKACVECMVLDDCVAGSIDCIDNRCVKAQAFVCTNGAGKCLDGKLHTCANNTWESGVDCPSNQECLDGADVCTAMTCSDDETKCLDGKLHTCSDNDWGQGVDCATDQECLDGAKECS